MVLFWPESNDVQASREDRGVVEELEEGGGDAREEAGDDEDVIDLGVGHGRNQDCKFG